MAEAHSSAKGNPAVVWVVVVCILGGAYLFRDSGTTSNGMAGDDTQEQTLTRDESIQNHWDEIKEYLEGTETVEACSLTSGNCYDLEADISSGSIDVIHFLNGGYQSFSADIEEDGSASDVDTDGNSWEFTLNMDSASVDEAIMEWANANGYTITD